MKGKDETQPSMIMLMNPEDRIPRDHPLRRNRKTMYRGKARTQLWAYMVGAAYNLMRMSKLCPTRE